MRYTSVASLSCLTIALFGCQLPEPANHNLIDVTSVAIPANAIETAGANDSICESKDASSHERREERAGVALDRERIPFSTAPNFNPSDLSGRLYMRIAINTVACKALTSLGTRKNWERVGQFFGATADDSYLVTIKPKLGSVLPPFVPFSYTKSLSTNRFESDIVRDYRTPLMLLGGAGGSDHSVQVIYSAVRTEKITTATDISKLMAALGTLTGGGVIVSSATQVFIDQALKVVQDRLIQNLSGSNNDGPTADLPNFAENTRGYIYRFKDIKNSNQPLFAIRMQAEFLNTVTVNNAIAWDNDISKMNPRYSAEMDFSTNVKLVENSQFGTLAAAMASEQSYKDLLSAASARNIQLFESACQQIVSVGAQRFSLNYGDRYALLVDSLRRTALFSDKKLYESKCLTFIPGLKSIIQGYGLNIDFQG